MDDIKAHIRFMKQFNTELRNAGELPETGVTLPGIRQSPRLAP